MTEQTDADIRIALDVEGVLAEIHEPFLADYNAMYDTAFTLDDITEWEFGPVRTHFAKNGENGTFSDFLHGTDTFDGFLDMTAAYWEEYASPDAANRLHPVEPDIGRYVQDLHDAVDAAHDNYRVDIVTAREDLEDEMQTWLHDHDIQQGDAYDTFIVAQDKHELPYNVYIDDNPRLADALGDDAYTDNILFLYDRPYNKDVDTDNHVRIDSLADAASVI